MSNESSSSRVFVILAMWSFGPQKSNDLVFEFKGEGCHRTATSQDNSKFRESYENYIF